MRKLYGVLAGFILANLAHGQSTYVATGPVNGQGPLLSTEDTGGNTGWTEIHSDAAGGGASVNSWSGAQILPFAFEFFGAPVTQFCVSKNFLLTFDVSVAGTTLPGGITTDNTALPNAALPNNTIAYFWGGFGSPAPIASNDDVWMKTYGSAPNRQLWIKNFSYEGEAQSYSYNILVIEETTNKIYVVDTRWAVAGAGSYTVGVQKDATTAVEQALSPAISSINGNMVSWNAADIYYYEFLPIIPSTDDVALISIDSPAFPLCSTSSNVEVTIGSTGANTLTSASINWAVNGFIQPSLAWTGNITQFNTESGISLGTYTFTDGDDLQVWVSNPNGTSDGDPTNDIQQLTVTFGLSGTKTIGTTGDYVTFADAIDEITQYGVCGNLVFNVQSGTYTEQILLPEIPGMSSTNTVTFQAASGDSSDVILKYNATSIADNYVVKFDGADYVTFRNMTLHNSSLSGFSRVLEVGGNSTNNSILHCEISGDTVSTSTSVNLALIYSASASPSTDSDWLFDSNRIVGGSHGVYWYGETSIPYEEKGTVFSNNHFEDNYYRGLRLYYQQGGTVINNIASYDEGYGTSLDVFYLSYCDSGVVVTGNYISLDSLYGDGISLAYCETTPEHPSIVANNQVIVNAPNTSALFYATYIGYSDYVNFYHNSVYANNTSTTARSFYSIGGIQNHLMNNVFVNEGAGYGLYYSGTSVTASDHNNIYVPNGTFGYSGSAVTSLGSWQTVTGMDANSLNLNPGFSGIHDLHTCEAALDGKGMTGLGITTDFDGELRSTSLPDIGADEFYAPENLALGNDTSKCVGQPVSLGGYEATPGTYLWSNGSTNESISVTLPGMYHVTISGTCGFVKDTILITDIPAPVADFSHTVSFLTAIVTDESIGATSWAWDFGDGGTSTLQNPIYVYDSPGAYTITLTVTNDCGTDVITSDFTASVVGMEEIISAEIRVYPNPANDMLNIAFTGWEFGNVQVEIMDLSGKVVGALNVDGGQQNFVQTIPVDDLEPGIYLVRFLSETGSAKLTKFEKI